MTIKEGEFNSELQRGVKVVCNSCHNQDKNLGDVLYFGEREPGKQLTKGQKLLARSTAEWHEKETSGKHSIWIMYLKKLVPWSIFD